jgi:hypothetical protein
MAGDPARARIVLFGGAPSNADGGGAVLAGDTWEWDQGQWIQLQDVGPAARTGAKCGAANRMRGLIQIVARQRSSLTSRAVR